MCGRFAVTSAPDRLRALFGYVEQPNFPPRYNIPPGQPIAIVRAERKLGNVNRHFMLVRWGFVPSFVKDFSAFRPFVNARSEDLDRPSLRAAFRRRRCLVMVDGFYLWQKSGSASRPFLVRRQDGSPFGMAGLFETWLGADGSEIDTACIVTRPAEPSLSAIAPRLPLVIDPPAFHEWLDPDELAVGKALALTQTQSQGQFECVPLGAAVNKAANDHESVQLSVGEPFPCFLGGVAQLSLFG